MNEKSRAEGTIPSAEELEIIKLKSRVEELEYQHFLDMSEIIRLRRYVEFLVDGVEL